MAPHRSRRRAPCICASWRSKRGPSGFFSSLLADGRRARLHRRPRAFRRPRPGAPAGAAHHQDGEQEAQRQRACNPPTGESARRPRAGFGAGSDQQAEHPRRGVGRHRPGLEDARAPRRHSAVDTERMARGSAANQVALRSTDRCRPAGSWDDTLSG
jgi:hypothetical protein